MKFRTKTELSIQVRSSQQVLHYAGFTLSISVCLYWLVRSFFYIPHDFSNSYFGAWFFVKGQFGVDIFDPYTFNKWIYDAGYRHVFASYSPNPPSTALLFSPLALLPLFVSKAAFNTLSCIFFFNSLYRLCKTKGLDPALLFLMIPVIFFVPIRNQILFGQTYFMILGLLIEGYLAYEGEKPWPMAIFWTLAIFLKIFPVIVFLFLLFRKEWAMSGKLLLCCVLLLVFCMLIQGVDVWKVYITEILPRSGKGEISGSYFINYQSLLMFLKYAFYGNAQLNPHPLIDSPLLFKTLLILFNATIIALAGTTLGKQNTLVPFGVLLAASILISPYGSTYTYLLLVVLFVGIYATFSQKQFIVATIAVFLIANLPLTIFERLAPVWQFPKLGLLIILFGAAVKAVGAKIDWRICVALIFIFGAPVAVRPHEPEDNSSFLEGVQRHSLVFDYGIRGGFIFYKYWDEEKGENIYDTAIPAVQLSEQGLELKGNQIVYYRKEITHSSDRKLKPTVIDGTTLVYLSDEERGIGFYNLRKIDLKAVMP